MHASHKLAAGSSLTRTTFAIVGSSASTSTLTHRPIASEALVAFEATLKKEPNRLGAYLGAAAAADKSGDNAKARDYYQKIVAIADSADGSRAEIADARAHLEKL